jgi:methyl-accepting chemotaxis protein
MQTERDLYVGIGALATILVLVSFGTVGLLMRMSPAIERILRENVVSLEASDEMMAALALRGAVEPEARLDTRFREALRRAQANVTEDEERPALELIAGHASGALRGDPADRAATVEALSTLHRVNSAAMRRADEQAKQLGIGGAWAMVFLTCLALGVSWAVLRRLRQRLITPLLELSTTLDAASRGDRHRRCRTMHAPAELARIMAAVNALLDQSALVPGGERLDHPAPDLSDSSVPAPVVTGSGAPSAPSADAPATPEKGPAG